MTTPAKVIAVAKAFAAKEYKEAKSDDTLFGRWYGMNHAAWCAMFVSYCFNDAGAGKLVAASTAKGFASCTAGCNWFRKHKAFFHAREAKPGDVVFMAFDGDLSDADHVGIVVSHDKVKKIVHTVEGNTTNPKAAGSQSRGDGVYLKARPYSLIVGIGRPKWPFPSISVPVETPKPKVAPIDPPKKPEVPKPAPVVKTYVVKAGDSYWRIAANHQVKGNNTNQTMLLFQRLNGGKALHPGDIIIIK